MADLVAGGASREGGDGPSSPGMHASARLRRTESGRLTTASGRVVATLPEAAAEQVALMPARAEPEVGPLAWVKQNPGFALLLLAITFVGPYLITEWRSRALRERLVDGLDRWQVGLEAAGLPTPWVAPVDVARPADLPDSSGPFNALGLGARHQALTAWSALRAGRDAPPHEAASAASDADARATDEAAWSEAVRACALLRRATADAAAGAPGETDAALDAARSASDHSPVRARPLLELVVRLLDGRADEVTGQATRLLGEGATSLTRPGLEALLVEARRRWAAQVLGASAPSPQDLRLIAHLGREGVSLREGLGAHLRRHVDALSPQDPGSLSRAAALVEVVAAAVGAPEAGPSDLADRHRALAARRAVPPPAWPAPERRVASLEDGAQQAWADLARHALDLAAARIAAFESDPAPALALVERVLFLDGAVLDLPPGAFHGWRDELQRVVNDPPRLRALAVRFFEAGWVPPGLEALHVASAAAAAPPVEPAATPGERLARLLVRVAALEAASPLAAADAAAIEVELDEADAQVLPRSDRLARRLVAQHAFLRGRVALARVLAAPDDAEQLARAAGAFAEAASLGYEPRARLERERARLLAGGGAAEARRTAPLDPAARRVDHLAELERLRARGLTPEVVVEWELQGWPADRRELAVARAEAMLELARLQVAANLAEPALKVTEEAAALHPDVAAPAHLARAKVLRSLGREADARAACEAGIEALVPGQAAVRAELEALRGSR